MRYFLIGSRTASSAGKGPTVFVKEPVSGETYLPDEMVIVAATAVGSDYLSRVELWVDGFQEGEIILTAEDLTHPGPFLATFDFHATEGLHNIIIRAIDQNGLIGQSLPVTIEIGLPGETTSTTSEGGETLEDIANNMDAEPDILHELNPDLGDGELPAGTNVNVPVPPPQPGGGVGAKAKQNKTDPPPVPPNTWEVLPMDSPVFHIWDVISVVMKNSPQAPGPLMAGYQDCQVRLLWVDNADNETHFNIWMQRVYGPPQLIEVTPNNPGSGPTQFVFKSPNYGIYDFWVEAENGFSAQPSEVIRVFVSDQTCNSDLATYLKIAAENFFVIGGYDRTYCYVSLEGGAEKRVPANDGEFIPVNNNWGDITTYWSGNSMTYPMPEDEELTIGIKCMGWQGGLLSSLGHKTVSVPRSKWDGSRQEIKFDNGSILGFHVDPTGSTQAEGSFQFTDYDLPAPKIVSVNAALMEVPEDRQWEAWAASHIVVSWYWEGNIDDISSFLLLFNGHRFQSIDKLGTQYSFQLPTPCGEDYEFQVVAVGYNGAESVPSSPYLYQQPDCDYIARLKFDTFTIKAHEDSEGPPNDCDEVELKISANGGGAYYPSWTSLSAWSTGKDVDCFKPTKFSDFSNIGDKDTYLIWWGPGPAKFNIGMKFTDVDTFIVPWDWQTLCYISDTVRLDEDMLNQGPTERVAFCATPRGAVDINYSVEAFSAPKSP